MFLNDPPPSADAERLLQSDTADGGYLMNLTRLWAWRPDVTDDFSALRRQLISRSKISRREFVVAACACVSQLGDSYCSLSFGTVLSGLADPATAALLLRGEMPAALTNREAAIAMWARQVAADPNATSPADVALLRAAGLDDKDIFELTAFVAFRIAFATVNDALGAQPDRQMYEGAPPEVQAAVDYGRPAAASASFVATTEALS
jgi:alkylhydroperoxidase family enzyme